MKKIVTIFLSAYLFLATTITAQMVSDIKANYAQAARYSPKRLGKLLYSTTVDPHWLQKSDRFWYMYETSEGKKWYIVDPAKALKKPMFDNMKMAASITRIVKDPFDAEHLPIENVKFIKDENAIQFQVQSSLEEVKKDTASRRPGATVREKKIFYFEYNLLTGELTEIADYKKPLPRPMWGTVSPDSQKVVFSRNFNLYWMDKASYEKAKKKEDDSSIVEHQLTKDGIEYYSYGGGGNGGVNETNVEKERNAKKRKPVFVFWSPDSKKFAMERIDQRKVKDLWVVHSAEEGRPTLETYKYHMPGETDAPVSYIYIFDMAAQSSKMLNTSAFKNQDLGIWGAVTLQNNRDNDFRSNTWLGDETKFYLNRTSRDLKRIDVCKVDVNTGEIKVLIPERLNTYVEIRRIGVVNKGKDLIEWSERDGWAHLYLYDEDGKLKNQITKGPYHVEDITNIDEKKRIVYFTANAMETNENPYYVHLYKINFDGTGLKLLDPGDYDHTTSMNDNAQYFIDTYSRVNTGPKTSLFASDGRKIMDLETTDLSRLMETGYKFPQTFKVKADDGVTDLFGVMYRPYDFDSTKKYPIIEYVYPGPQTESVNKAFSRSMDYTDRLAQMGFIVITIGNRGGNPARSKWYHNFGYGNLRDYGLADKKTAVEQLADRYKFIDLDKVGITGHSGGGFMSTAALLAYPDFYKVAVSESGNHDNSIYNRAWSEKHHGVREEVSENGDTAFLYNIEKNPDLAKNLKGRLMLSTGDIDNNVSPANTIRMANALIKANKRFEFVMLPNQRHSYGEMTEYFFWCKADYFAKYLLGDFNQPVDMMEMNRDMEQTGEKARPPAAAAAGAGGAGRRRN